MTNPTAPSLPTGIWKLDPATTTIATSQKHLGLFTVRANLTVADSTITMAANEEGELGGSVKVVVDAASYNSGMEKRDHCARATDFLDVQEHPTFDFVGTSMEPVASGYRVTGDVTIKGQTSTIVFDVTAIDADGDRASFTATTTVDRQTLGVPKLPSFVIGNAIDVSVAAIAIRQS
jgi:polyisoprenoid-binding protein YceI